MQFAGRGGESTRQKGGGRARLRQTGCEARRGPHPRLTLAEPELEIWVEGRPERGGLRVRVRGSDLHPFDLLQSQGMRAAGS